MSDVSTKKLLSHSQRCRLSLTEDTQACISTRGSMLSLHEKNNASQPTVILIRATCWVARKRVILHLHTADATACAVTSIDICSTETDVLVLALCNYPGQHCAETNFIMGAGKARRTIQLIQVYDAHERSFILNLRLTWHFGKSFPP